MKLIYALLIFDYLEGMEESQFYEKKPLITFSEPYQTAPKKIQCIELEGAKRNVIIMWVIYIYPLRYERTIKIYTHWKHSNGHMRKVRECAILPDWTILLIV
jgi:hypothetical protein